MIFVVHAICQCQIIYTGFSIKYYGVAVLNMATNIGLHRENVHVYQNSTWFHLLDGTHSL